MLDAFGVERADISKGFKSPRMVARYLGNIAGETTGRATKEVEDSGARLMQDFERRATRTAVKVGAASAGAGIVGTAGATYANKKIRNYKSKAPVSTQLTGR